MCPTCGDDRLTTSVALTIMSARGAASPPTGPCKDYTPDTEALRHRLSALPCPARRCSSWTADAASLFLRLKLAVQPGAGRYPWLGDPRAFTAMVEDFLCPLIDQIALHRLRTAAGPTLPL